MLRLLRRRRASETGLAAVYKAVSHVVAARQGDRTILLDAQRGRYFGVDEVGAAIWRMLAGASTLAQLVDGLEQEYAAPRETLEQDARAFLARLERARLVEVT